MRPTSYQSEDLDRLLRKHKIATLDDLKAVLGTDVDSTVFRKLNELAYRTSYSHRGSYYTLDEIAQFDRKGLWSLRSVWFSKYGTLLATVKALVAACEAGYYVDELEDVVQVDVKAPLLKLVREKRLAREQVFGRYLYLATDVSTRKQQLSARQVHEASPSTLGWVGGVRVLPVELKAAIVLFYSLLDEKQRRLYAGVEAMKLGHGGDQQIAELLGMGQELLNLKNLSVVGCDNDDILEGNGSFLTVPIDPSGVAFQNAVHKVANYLRLFRRAVVIAVMFNGNVAQTGTAERSRRPDGLLVQTDP